MQGTGGDRVGFGKRHKLTHVQCGDPISRAVTLTSLLSMCRWISERGVLEHARLWPPRIHSPFRTSTHDFRILSLFFFFFLPGKSMHGHDNDIRGALHGKYLRTLREGGRVCFQVPIDYLPRHRSSEHRPPSSFRPTWYHYPNYSLRDTTTKKTTRWEAID